MTQNSDKNTKKTLAGNRKGNYNKKKYLGNKDKDKTVPTTGLKDDPAAVTTGPAKVTDTVTTSDTFKAFDSITAYQDFSYLYNGSVGDLYFFWYTTDFEPCGHYANTLQRDIEVSFYNGLKSLGEKMSVAKTAPSFTDVADYLQAAFGAMRYIYFADGLRWLFYNKIWTNNDGAIVVPEQIQWFTNHLRIQDGQDYDEIDNRKLTLTHHVLPPMWQELARYMMLPHSSGLSNRIWSMQRPAGLALADSSTFLSSIDTQLGQLNTLRHVGAYISSILNWKIAFKPLVGNVDSSDLLYLMENYPLRDDQLRAASYTEPKYVMSQTGTLTDFQLALTPLHINGLGYEGYAGALTTTNDRNTIITPTTYGTLPVGFQRTMFVNPAISENAMPFGQRIPVPVTGKMISEASRRMISKMFGVDVINELLSVVDGSMIRTRRYVTARGDNVQWK
jgi:hypothetical protein